MEIILNNKFNEKTSLDELQIFCDSLTCPNYSYSDVLKLHAYYISKKEIKLKDFKQNTMDNQLNISNEEDEQYELNKNDQSSSQNSSSVFGSSDSENNYDENQEGNENITKKTYEKPQTKINKKVWSENEIDHLINGVNKYGNQWQKIIKSNPGIFLNKSSTNLRNKASQLKKDPKYSHLFDS